MTKGIKLIGKSTDAFNAYLGRAEETDGLLLTVSQWVPSCGTRQYVGGGTQNL